MGYGKTVTKLPLAKDIEEFDFTDTPINKGLFREPANGASSLISATWS